LYTNKPGHRRPVTNQNKVDSGPYKNIPGSVDVNNRNPAGEKTGKEGCHKGRFGGHHRSVGNFERGVGKKKAQKAKARVIKGITPERDNVSGGWKMYGFVQG